MKTIRPRTPCKLKSSIKQLPAIIAALFLGIGGHLRAAVVVEPPGATVAGKTIAEWSTNWWRWAAALAPPGDPFTDTTGQFANVNQSGPVFFLAGSPGGSNSRHFKVPANTYVLVPLLASEWSQLELGFDKTAAEIRQAAQQQANQINSLHATLDGTPISQATLFTHRQVSPDFSFVAVANNQVGINTVGNSGIAVADGYFLMLRPLTPGIHVLTYGGGASAFGISISETDTITVVLAPIIIEQPTGQAVFAGSNATFRVTADGEGTLLYQWRFNQADIAGATNATLVITNVQPEQPGSYTVVITNNYGALTSSIASLRLLAWSRTYNGPANNYDGVQALAVDGSGNAVVTGHSHNGTNLDYYTTKYTATDGAVLWEKRYNGPGNGDDAVTAMAVDGSGNVVVTGSSGDWGTNDYYTAKYAAADGVLLWEKRYDGPGNGIDYPYAMAIDANGNVVVTGSSENGPPNYGSDYCTVKYAAADGALLWEKRYNGPANTIDEARAVAVDGDDNVVVTGASYRADITTDYYTAKYAATNGALLWERRYNGPANKDDTVAAMAIDRSGNVVVTGTSYNGDPSFGGNIDYYTAKYAAANGALIWEKRYNGPANSVDDARAVAVDGSGNVVVTGFSYNGAPNYDSDYYTAKYAAANGAIVWAKRYNGPEPGYDYATALAVDASGNVVVVGSSNDADSYVVAYAAADGAVIWDYRHSSSSLVKLALDSGGNVVTAGLALNSNYDFLTSKILTGLPQMPAYRFTSILFTNGLLHLDWTLAPGAVLQRTASLTTPNWQTVVGSMNTTRITVPANDASGFFQLVKQ